MLHRLQFGELLQSSTKKSQNCNSTAARINFMGCRIFLSTFLTSFKGLSLRLHDYKSVLYHTTDPYEKRYLHIFHCTKN